ncbi:MAG: hypothetical protein WBA38_11835 [Gordonia sp. (in: high G+C Gram-positive bacteria)]|uniref:hypothetical protein n=1 Tax=Gordonia sp. (in: high G+C Gram-positive bacteria) TaxID=84139 RepID=UPI003C7886A0
MSPIFAQSLDATKIAGIYSVTVESDPADPEFDFVGISWSANPTGHGPTITTSQMISLLRAEADRIEASCSCVAPSRHVHCPVHGDGLCPPKTPTTTA